MIPKITMVMTARKSATRKLALSKLPHSGRSPSAAALETMGETMFMQIKPTTAIVKNIEPAIPDAPRLSAARNFIRPTWMVSAKPMSMMPNCPMMMGNASLTVLKTF